MMNDTLENRRNSSKNEAVISDPFNLEILVQEMQETLFMESYHDIDSISGQNIGYMNNGKQDSFGYDLENGGNLGTNQSIYHRKRLRHKLVRIQKEFQFAQKFLRNYQSLTSREKEIVRLLAKGMNNPAIAQQLFISRYTVEQHRKNINHKLKLRSITNLLRYAYAFNLI